MSRTTSGTVVTDETTTTQAADEAASPWQHQIIEQIADVDTEGQTHLVIYIEDAVARLLIVTDSQEAADIALEDFESKPGYDAGDVEIVQLDDLWEWHQQNKDTPTVSTEEQADAHMDEIEATAAELDESRPESDDGTHAALFNPNVYEDPALELKTKEGRRIDEIVIGFSGAITLNRNVVDDVDLYKRLTMGHEVEFQVTGKISGDALTIKPPTDKRRELLSGKRTITIHSLEEN